MNSERNETGSYEYWCCGESTWAASPAAKIACDRCGLTKPRCLVAAPTGIKYQARIESLQRSLAHLQATPTAVGHPQAIVHVDRLLTQWRAEWQRCQEESRRGTNG